jgi:predicted Zn-ribbon and HTH transcriptional regulator
MNNAFKAVVSSEFLKMIEDSLVGREVSLKTGLKVCEILKHVELNAPSSLDLQWTINWASSFISVMPEQVDFLLILLKYAWLYSQHKETNDQLIETVARELKEFEKSIVLEEVNEKLIDSHVIVKTQAQEIKQKKKELKIVGKELVERRAKARKISFTNSNSARKPRSCPEVNEWILELVKGNPKSSIIALWRSISKNNDGRNFYRTSDRLNHFDCENSCPSFGLKAFYKRVQSARREILRSAAKKKGE